TPSYTSEEKAAIARAHLLPKQLEAHGLSGANVELTDEALNRIIAAHTREAGVRGLEKRLADVCRTLAVEKASGTLVEPRRVEFDEIEPILGPDRFQPEVREDAGVPGVAEGRAQRRRDAVHRPGVAALRRSSPHGYGDDRGGHAARSGAAGRRDQGEGARCAPSRPQAGGDPAGLRCRAARDSPARPGRPGDRAGQADGRGADRGPRPSRTGAARRGVATARLFRLRG